MSYSRSGARIPSDSQPQGQSFTPFVVCTIGVIREVWLPNGPTYPSSNSGKYIDPDSRSTINK